MNKEFNITEGLEDQEVEYLARIWACEYNLRMEALRELLLRDRLDEEHNI